ncbi:MAG: aminotransferase class I/II-fold pyridoxal phosphate-dependent enzyme, partial [Lachnospiraceae bacterium]|nr:aminotransferase class I/II-fold pyridoxal phosphate-dependent enzyme [Lachnospiraceae bacterium]
MSHGGDIYRNSVHTDLSVNLNPYGTPDLMLDAAAEGIRLAAAYPDSEQEEVRSAIAAADGVAAECVFAGNGASELILASVRAVAPKTALLIEPCFSGYRHALKSLRGCEIREMYLREEEDFRLGDGVIGCMDEGVDMVFITDPWNPTGQPVGGELLLKILAEAQRRHIYVLLDQSFYLMSGVLRGDPVPESS